MEQISPSIRFWNPAEAEKARPSRRASPFRVAAKQAAILAAVRLTKNMLCLLAAGSALMLPATAAGATKDDFEIYVDPGSAEYDIPVDKEREAGGDDDSFGAGVGKGKDGKDGRNSRAGKSGDEAGADVEAASTSTGPTGGDDDGAAASPWMVGVWLLGILATLMVLAAVALSVLPSHTRERVLQRLPRKLLPSGLGGN